MQKMWSRGDDCWSWFLESAKTLSKQVAFDAIFVARIFPSDVVKLIVQLYVQVGIQKLQREILREVAGTVSYEVLRDWARKHFDVRGRLRKRIKDYGPLGRMYGDLEHALRSFVEKKPDFEACALPLFEGAARDRYVPNDPKKMAAKIAAALPPEEGGLRNFLAARGYLMAALYHGPHYSSFYHREVEEAVASGDVPGWVYKYWFENRETLTRWTEGLRAQTSRRPAERSHKRKRSEVDPERAETWRCWGGERYVPVGSFVRSLMRPHPRTGGSPRLGEEADLAPSPPALHRPEILEDPCPDAACERIAPLSRALPESPNPRVSPTASCVLVWLHEGEHPDVPRERALKPFPEEVRKAHRAREIYVEIHHGSILGKYLLVGYCLWVLGNCSGTCS
jgi:hypothetical protein